MNPLILQFAEKPVDKCLDFSAIEYSKDLNLSVARGTLIPAISSLSLQTETFTKGDYDVTDSDHDRFGLVMSTSTQTHHQLESSDSDNLGRNLAILMATTTLSETVETTDQDNDSRCYT